MSLLSITGFETRHLSAQAGESAEGPEYRVNQDYADKISTLVKRTGAACFAAAFNGARTPRAARLFVERTYANDVTYFHRVYLRKSADPANPGYALQVASSGGAGYYVLMETDGTISLYYKTSLAGGATKIGSSSGVLSSGTFYRVELSTLRTAGGAGSAELRVDGITVATDTARASVPAPVSFTIGDVDSSTSTGTWYFDDLAVNDSTVPPGFSAGQYGAQDTWPGAGRVYLLRPVSDNARHADWYAGAGGTANLWDAVNNTPPVGVDFNVAMNASEIKHLDAAGAGEDYDANLQTYTAAGVPSDETVKIAQPLVNLTDDGGGAEASLRIMSNPAGADYAFNPGTGGTGTFPSGWKTFRGPVIYLPSVALGTAPVLRARKREGGQLAVDLMGLYVESGDPGPGGGLSMLLG